MGNQRHFDVRVPIDMDETLNRIHIVAPSPTDEYDLNKANQALQVGQRARHHVLRNAAGDALHDAIRIPRQKKPGLPNFGHGDNKNEWRRPALVDHLPKFVFPVLPARVIFATFRKIIGHAGRKYDPRDVFP
jgi:hypothetical protein